MLVTWIDIAFALGGCTVIAIGLRKRWEIPLPVEYRKETSIIEILLSGLALAAAAIGPNILVVALTPGMPGMPLLSKWLLLPSLLLLTLVAIAATLSGMERLRNRLWAGIWIGAATTAALDVIRLTGFQMGYMPGDLPRMFGVLILDQMARGPSTASDIVGSLYHYWVGACLGIAFTVFMGRFRWWGGLIWGLIVELGMMVTPPMVVAMDTGYFGLKKGYGILVVTMLAHIAFGVALGMLSERYVIHKGGVIHLVRGFISGKHNNIDENIS